MEVLKDPKIIERILNKGVEQILPSSQALKELLNSGKKLNIYQGFDPTADTLHIGHTVGMRKLEDFRKLGHQVIFFLANGINYSRHLGDVFSRGTPQIIICRLIGTHKPEGGIC